MFSTYILITIIIYFLGLFALSQWSAKGADDATFFKANNSAPWYLVAFGMIGASLSGVTFVSVPGWVATSGFTYMQMVMGYLLGYFLIVRYLLPLYYRLNLTTIYSYFNDRIGPKAHLTASVFFLLSRIVGASFRMFLVVLVLQEFVFDDLEIDFWMTTVISIALIWVYTYKGGIKTVVWTDTLQTLFMLIAAGITIYSLHNQIQWETLGADTEELFRWFDFADWRKGSFFPRHFLSGALIALVMTGMDQDMMQKNLTCRDLPAAQKNVLWFSGALFFVNIAFLLMGAYLTIFAQQQGLEVTSGDKLFPTVVRELSLSVSIIFVLGVIAAAYSSADSALTSLTTSFSVDIVKLKEGQTNKRYLIHAGFSVAIIIVVILFSLMTDRSVIVELFKAAGYTYGPILGMFSFGLISRREVNDNRVPLVCILAPLISFGLSSIPPEFIGGFVFGFEVLFLNGLLTYIGLYLCSSKS